MIERALKTGGVPIASMLKRGEVKILVVEDDKFLREILVGKLEKEGYTVFEASNCNVAQKHIQGDRPHVILLDIVLPGIDGFEVLSTLKRNRETSAIPIIIISNLGSREDVDRALRLGAKSFMIKAHHTPQEIVDAVKKTLEEYYLRR